MDDTDSPPFRAAETLSRTCTDRTLRVGMLGCGYIAHIHTRAMMRTGAVEVYAADVDERAAEHLVRTYGGKVEQPTALLRRTDLDVVYLCTPHDVRQEPLMSLTRSGALVVCEKPLALTGAEAERIGSALGHNRNRVVLAFNQRFMPGVQELRSWLGTRTDEARRVRIDVTTPPFLDSWAGTPERGGGALTCIGSHALDLWRYLLGRQVVRVRAVGSRAHVGDHLEHDTAALIVEDDAGMISTITLQDSGSTWWSMGARRMLDIDIRLEKSAARATAVSITTWDDEASEVLTRAHVDGEASDFLEEWGYAAMARAVRSRAEGATDAGRAAGDDVLATLEDGIECAHLVDRARRSADSTDARTPDRRSNQVAGEQL